MPESNKERSQYPFTIARSTGTECEALLAALNAATRIDEISNIADWEGFYDYVAGQGNADEEGKLRHGVIVWLYQTGLHGPYHETDDGTIEHHGVLMTIEKGVTMDEVMRRAKATLHMGVITHEHIAASSAPW